MQEEDQKKGNNIVCNLKYTKHLPAITSYSSSEQPHFELWTKYCHCFHFADETEAQGGWTAYPGLSS